MTFAYSTSKRWLLPFLLRRAKTPLAGGGARSTQPCLQYSSQLWKAFLRRACHLLSWFVCLEMQLALMYSRWEAIKQRDFLEHQWHKQSSGWSKWKGQAQGTRGGHWLEPCSQQFLPSALPYQHQTCREGQRLEPLVTERPWEARVAVRHLRTAGM